MSFGHIIDKVGEPLFPGDIVVYSDRGDIKIGVVHEKATNSGGKVLRIRYFNDKGKGTPWGNSGFKSMRVSAKYNPKTYKHSDEDQCYGVVKLRTLIESDYFSNTVSLSKYMEQKGKIGAIKKEEIVEINKECFAEDMISKLGAPNIK